MKKTKIYPITEWRVWVEPSDDTGGYYIQWSFNTKADAKSKAKEWRDDIGEIISVVKVTVTPA